LRKKKMFRQKTIRKEISCSGIGLHSGKEVSLRFKPAAANTGIIFRRKDLKNFVVRPLVKFLSKTSYATSIRRGNASIETVEHLLATLYVLGIDDLIVELNSPEVPIMDGSAAPFIYLLHEAGIRSLNNYRRVIRIKKPIKIEYEDKSIAFFPSPNFRVTYTIEFDHPLISRQKISLPIRPKTFAEEIAPARTFGFLKQVEKIRKNGYAKGGSLDNAIIIGESTILNKSLRFENEFVRHKALDAIGDLAFLQHQVVGHLVAVKGGHSLHIELVKKILAERECWEFVSPPSKVLAPALRTPALSKEKVGWSKA